MSMNGFFKAYTQDQLDSMAKDHTLIDKWAWDDDLSALSACVDDSWDVIANVVDGAGMYIGEQIEGVLSNGCSLISATEVAQEYQKLKNWTDEAFWQAVLDLDDDDIYHLESSQDEDGNDMVLEAFNALKTFYKEASERKLGAIFYMA